MTARVSVPDGLLRGLPGGEYAIDDPRLKGRGHYWASVGLAVVVSGEIEADEPAKKPRKRKDKDDEDL